MQVPLLITSAKSLELCLFLHPPRPLLLSLWLEAHHSYPRHRQRPQAPARVQTRVPPASRALLRYPVLLLTLSPAQAGLTITKVASQARVVAARLLLFFEVVVMTMVALQRVAAVVLRAQSHYGLAQTGRVFGFLRLVLELGC